MAVKIFQPSLCCFIVMGTCINHTVLFIFVRKIRAVFRTVKGKLQNLHSRKTTFLQHVHNRIRKDSKILCNHIQVLHLLLQHIKQSISGTFLPFAILCCLRAIRNRIILIKSAKMIDSRHIIPFLGMCHSANPPLISCLFMIGPVVKGISPKLSGRGKRIRRTSCYRNRRKIFVKLEQFGICPGICTVECHIDRHISDDLNAFFIYICFQSAPLFCEPVLLEIIKSNLLCQTYLCLLHSLRLTALQFLRPIQPADASQIIFDSHIQAVILQPVAVFFQKILIFLLIISAPPLKGKAKKFKTGFI